VSCVSIFNDALLGTSLLNDKNHRQSYDFAVSVNRKVLIFSKDESNNASSLQRKTTALKPVTCQHLVQAGQAFNFSGLKAG